MNRRSFIQNLSAAGLAGTLATPVAATEAPAAAPTPAPAAPLRDAPAVYAPTPDGAVIVWAVPPRSVGWIEFGEHGSDAPGRLARGDAFGFVPYDQPVLRVRLTGLKPGQRYWFKTHTRPVVLRGYDPAQLTITTSQTYALRLPGPAASETRFCVWNDTHDRPTTLARLAELTRAEPADFLVWNGDVGNYLNDATALPGLFVQPKGDVNLAAGPPILLTRGNHDVRGPAANRVADCVAFPGDRPYYSFRVGPVAAVVLDTGEDKPDDHPLFLGLVNFEPLIREQARWLEREIEQPHLKNAPYRLVICHIPLRWRDESQPTYDPAGRGYDRFSRRGRDAWHAALTRWGAQLVISGHTHSWAHLPPTDAFPYAQLVGGGPALDESRSQALLIRGHANADALTFRLLNAATAREVFQLQLAPCA
jgi:hypothetical protein